MSADKLPADALVAAASVTMQASDNGHDVGDEPRWRRLSRRVYAAPCQRCERLVIVSDMPSLGGWKAGGTATTAVCIPLKERR
jgi:hypothetical protein